MCLHATSAAHASWPLTIPCCDLVSFRCFERDDQTTDVWTSEANPVHPAAPSLCTLSCTALYCTEWHPAASFPPHACHPTPAWATHQVNSPTPTLPPFVLPKMQGVRGGAVWPRLCVAVHLQGGQPRGRAGALDRHGLGVSATLAADVVGFSADGCWCLVLHCPQHGQLALPTLCAHEWFCFHLHFIQT